MLPVHLIFMYSTTLLGGEFTNIYGHGKTEKDAVKSLKMRLIQLRKIRDKHNI